MLFNKYEVDCDNLELELELIVIIHDNVASCSGKRIGIIALELLIDVDKKENEEGLLLLFCKYDR